MLWHAFIMVWVFVFGAIVGSFLNVVVLRYRTGISIFRGRSRCFSCGKKLVWNELIPILSFVIQKGRCRRCGSRISWQYLTVELTSGVLFTLIFNFQFSIFNEFSMSLIFNTIYLWIIASLLIVIAVYDFRHKIIPDLFVWLFNSLAFLSILLLNRHTMSVLESTSYVGFVAAGFAFASFFALLWLVSKGRWMGLGDAKLALGLGWLLGPEKTILAFLFSFWLGGIVGIILLLPKRKKYSLKSQIPFGPFLIAGSLLAMFLNFNIWHLIYIW